MTQLSFLAIFGLFTRIAGFPSLRSAIPNGNRVFHEGQLWPAVGHNQANFGSFSNLNPFGEAFDNAGRQWSDSLCKADSDNDGLSNGEELGDPDCIWTRGDTPSRTTNITNPGLAEDSDIAEPGFAVNLEAAGVVVATISLILWLVIIVAIGAIAMRNLQPKWQRLLTYPGPKGLNLGNLFGIILVLVGMIAYVVGVGVAEGFLVALGLAAGISLSLPIWWAFTKKGIHSVLEISRESAWRLHIIFGDIALIFGLAHGIYAIRDFGASIFSSVGYMFGFIGLTLILLGIAPAAAHAVAPRVVTYDRWKLLHFASLLGYILTLVHVWDMFNLSRSAQVLIVAMLNVLALAAYAVQFAYVKNEYDRVRVVDAAVMKEEDSQHMFLRLHAPGYKYAPGQWGYLRAPSISAVAHPFTIVPDKADDHIQFFMKVSGKFTRKLSDACMREAMPALELQGPCGHPALPAKDVGAAVFVLGGVGVTPALSLVAEARRVYGDRVRVYWNVRSKALLHQCAPFLEPHLKPELQCIRLTKSPVSPTELTNKEIATSHRSLPTLLEVREDREQSWPELRAVIDSIQSRDKSVIKACVKNIKPRALDEQPPDDQPSVEQPLDEQPSDDQPLDEQLPLGAKYGREEVGKWLETVAADLAAEGVTSALVFVCGPAQLAAAVKQSASKASSLKWRVHLEQFEFLPLPKLSKKPICRARIVDHQGEP